MLTMYLHPELFYSEGSSLPSHEILRYAADDNNKIFNYFMQLQGEGFREQNGRRTQRVAIGDKTYFIKQHFGIGWKEVLKNFLQFKLPIFGAKNEWLALEKLKTLAVATPAIRAYGSRGFNPAGQQSFLLMEELTPIVSLEDFCRDWKKQAPNFSLKLRILRKVAEIARTLHENGINHRDFYICHFLLDKNSLAKDEVALKIYLIDLHRAGLYQKLPLRWQVKDLAGLYFSSKDLGLSQRDYWRFIKTYRQQALRDIIKTELPFWRTVMKRGEKLYDAHIVPQH